MCCQNSRHALAGPDIVWIHASLFDSKYFAKKKWGIKNGCDVAGPSFKGISSHVGSGAPAGYPSAFFKVRKALWSPKPSTASNPLAPCFAAPVVPTPRPSPSSSSPIAQSCRRVFHMGKCKPDTDVLEAAPGSTSDAAAYNRCLIPPRGRFGAELEDEVAGADPEPMPCPDSPSAAS